MRRAWWFLVRVKSDGGAAETGKEQVGRLECTVPASKLDEAITYLEGALHAHQAEVIDILFCEQYDLDDWDPEDGAVGSDFWKHINEVVTRNEVCIGVLTPTQRWTRVIPGHRVWAFMVRLRVLKYWEPEIEGKLAWCWYFVPETRLNEAIAALEREIDEEGNFEIVEITRCELYDLEEWDFEQWPKGSDAWRMVHQTLSERAVLSTPLILHDEQA